MHYREVRPDELLQFQRADSYCFGCEAASEIGEWARHCARPEQTRGIFDDNGVLRAGLVNFPLAVYIEGARLAMGAVGSVVSLPEYRRGGNVDQLLLRLLAEEKEKGVPLSSLYPFKQSFYRRYGWEVASAWLHHQIPLELLVPCMRSGGVVRRFAPGEADWQVLASLYGARFSGAVGYIVRETAQDWDDRVFSMWNPAGPHYFTALWFPAEAAPPEGYLLYRFVKNDKGEQQLMIKELVALTAAAERGLWGYAARHDSQVRTLIHRTPRDYPLWHLVENTKDVKSELISGWMLRFVDIAAAFSARPWPGAPDAAFVIAVADEQLPWNHGTFRLTFEAGGATLVPAPAETPVLAGDVRTWAQLYAGFVRPSQALATGLLTCTDLAALRTLEYATAGKEMWFYEFF